MEGMFQLCNELESLDLSNFDTSNVENMQLMFSQCSKLKEIKGINKFITSKVINMCAMFSLCCEIEYLDLSNFDTSKVINMDYIFYECNKLKYLNLLNFSMNGEIENMFSFKNKGECKLITNNNKLLKLYNSSD